MKIKIIITLCVLFIIIMLLHPHIVREETGHIKVFKLNRNKHLIIPDHWKIQERECVGDITNTDYMTCKGITKCVEYGNDNSCSYKCIYSVKGACKITYTSMDYHLKWF